MKISHGAKNALSSLFNLIEDTSAIMQALTKSAKRKARQVVYPCDLKAVKIVLETIHDVTGKAFSVEVINGNIDEAIEMLSNYVKEEDYILELV